MADFEYFGVPPSDVRNEERRYRYIANSGQVDFMASYDVGFVDVYKNGVKLDPVTDFTATDRVKITLSVGATLNDKIQIITRKQAPTLNFQVLYPMDISAVYPVGSVYSNTSSSNSPSNTLGFGVWSFLGQASVVVSGTTIPMYIWTRTA